MDRLAAAFDGEIGGTDKAVFRGELADRITAKTIDGIA